MVDKFRGTHLDKQLQSLLELMLNEGYTSSPISRSAVMRRLNIRSRSTLAAPQRLEIIEYHRLVQLKNAGLDAKGKKKRNSISYQNDELKQKLEDIKAERDNLLEKFILVTNGLQARGLDVNEIMLPLRSAKNRLR